VILNSPTTTPRDRTAMEQLAALAGVDPIAFGRDMFTSTSDVSSVAASQLVARDAKLYELPTGQSLAIAQVETVGVVPEDRTEELLEAARAECERGGHRLFALMLTDVLAQGTRLIVAGDVGFAEQAFGATAQNGVIDLPGVMSRKKQVAPRLLAA
jgi:manganese-dependent inorganic pyrophosphatase